MKKFPLFAAAIAAVMVLSAPVAYATPSPTEPDRQEEIRNPDLEEITDPNVPLDQMNAGGPDVPPELTDIGDPDVPLDLVDIEDPGVPMAFVPAPQTGAAGLCGLDALALAAAVSSVSGAALIAKARKQTGSVR